MKTINVITLGCSKNIVDSEKIMAQLAASGYRVVHNADRGFDVAIVNTCGFIQDAKEESIEMILDLAAAKSNGTLEKLYVIGCLSQRYKDELRNEIPEVDSFFGARDLTEIVRELCGGWTSAVDPSRLLSTPAHYAYLKISEGCDRRCGFCAIPHIRGPQVSLPIESLVAEAGQLARAGVRELMVIAQDTTSYGTDIYGKRMLGPLLKALCAVEGIEWIRLHYAYPAGFPDDVIEVMASETKICKYLDIPFQHIADGQLAAMKRGIDAQKTYELIARLRERIPGLALRTTLMVGYPGESEEDFDQLLEFVAKVQFERLGVFRYSEEEGTWAADHLADHIPEQVKQQRLERIMGIQEEISTGKNRSMVGKRVKVIVDSVDGEYVTARSQFDSPEVDQEILVRRTEGLCPGDFIEVTVTQAESFDMYAVISG